ncbi:G-type lectin S-receptor-like serine/threonine-protein kinase At4g03230 isoform X1 [Camellia sinensis]|uniref:G-type lectin S-receptor-like serine/threonine-protein kinase At4g03230 isoform X1 n=1 Tax=Camellia sinensis TaxID=4442 RepID=UPI001035B7B7|nr:G-type lectin S-receptor-like serine/threonine-protein kinase At4g03230 isoform X1 [Camellia sinensis]
MCPVMKENGAYTTTAAAAAAVKSSYNFHSNFTPPSTIFIIFGILLLLGPSIFCLAAAAITARDTITPGNSIRDIYNETLISAGKKFQLGFFSPMGESGHPRYMGIWYYMLKPQTIVWVANPDSPLFSRTGAFTVAEDDGNLNLNLKDMDGNSINVATGLTNSQSLSNRTTVKLLDSGNLVLSDDLSGILWQSFYHPTDTFLPGMMMDDNLKLTSWKSVNDPASGNFAFGKYQSNNYIIWKSNKKYWRSGGSGIFDSSDQKLLYKILPLLSNSSNGKNITYYGKNLTIPPVLIGNITRLVMSYSGELKLFNWDNGQWSLIWSEPRDKYSVYNACGDFGSCNGENSGVKYCKCLPGFEPTSPDEWNASEFSSGCTRKTTMCLTDKKKYTFLKLKKMKVEGPDPDSTFEAISEEDCEKECVRDCNCQAYSYIASSVDAQRVPSTNSSGCIIWTSPLRNLHESTEGAHNLSVRVVRTDIELTSRDCEPCGANILPYPLRTGQNCGDPMYNNFRCNKSAGQVEFHEPSGIYRVTSINPDNLTFIIELTDTVKNADICRANNFRVSPSLPYKVIGSSCNASLAVEISWDPAPQPTCTSLEDCKDWPNSSCNTTADGKRRCLCNANYQWDGLKLNCTTHGQGKKKSFSFVIHFMVVMILVVLICIGGYIWYKRRKLKQRQESRESVQRNQALCLFDTERRVKNLIDSGEFKEDDRKGIDVPFFDLESVLVATNTFSDANKLGQGGFGPVYKGIFLGGQEIAVKRLSSHSVQGLKEFKNEVVLIAKLQHRNLVRLLGYCIKGDEKILLYEYMPNRSLDSFIFDRTLCVSLDWDKRFDIILGIARGLLYLHQDSRLRIIHRDLKTSNILLDGEMNPKISDFGLARIVGGKETEANTARVVGTYGYMSPEYALDGLFSIKSDVFSFGVIVLEIVSGKRNTGFYKSQQAFNLLGHAWRFWREEKALDLMDQTLLESCNRGEVMKCITVGLLCVQEEPSDRPSMPNVVFMLGSETATLPNPKPPAFLAKNWLSDAPSSSSSSSSSKPETFSNSALTVSVEEGR